MACTVKTGAFPDPPENLSAAIESLRPRWDWIVALGVSIAGMGVAALILGAARIWFGLHLRRTYTGDA